MTASGGTQLRLVITLWWICLMICRILTPEAPPEVPTETFYLPYIAWYLAEYPQLWFASGEVRTYILTFGAHTCVPFPVLTSFSCLQVMCVQKINPGPVKLHCLPEPFEVEPKRWVLCMGRRWGVCKTCLRPWFVMTMSSMHSVSSIIPRSEPVLYWWAALYQQQSHQFKRLYDLITRKWGAAIELSGT